MADYSKDNASFLIYKDWELLFDSLDSNEQAGQLIKALFAFAKRGEIAEFTGALKMAFIMMSQQIERDGEKWERRVERLKENGSKGGRPKKEEEKPNGNQKNQMVFEETKRNQTEPKKADTVTDTVTVTVTDTVIDTVTDNIYTPKKQTFSDEIQQIVDYLNAKCNTNYRTTTEKTRKFIIARLKEKFTVDDFKIVIDKKSAEWLSNAEMVKFLRPETLFGTKFENYLNQQAAQPKLAPNEMARKTDPWAI